MTADLGPEVTWALGVLVLMAVTSVGVIAYAILSYPRIVWILLVAAFVAAVVPYSIGWLAVRETGIEVEDP